MRNRKRVFYNSHGEEALYAMIRAAAGDDVELLTLEHDDDAERNEVGAERPDLRVDLWYHDEV